MSRLENHQQKQFVTKVIGLCIVLFLVLYFIFAFGIRMLLGVSVFIANLTNKNVTTQTSKIKDVYGTISIDSIPSATNSAKIMVSGTLTNYTSASLYLNGEKIKDVVIDSSDGFTEEIGDLRKGTNEVFAKAIVKDSSQKKMTQVYTVLYKSEKPKLELSEPSDKSKTSKQEITVKGSTDKEIYIKINDLPIVVDANGNFQSLIQLKDGDNQITISAQDIAGNIETKTISVTYQKDE